MPFAAWFVLGWLALVLLLLWGNKRWCDRMEQMDKDMDEAFCHGAGMRRTLHKKYGRKYG